ncbi:hypothetical protein, partial [Sinorhizobium meliloti]|uniref:hypothetical protein n=1 Tax=Rhizobium meliloti TaxID=382 RepID=UPI001AEEA729
PSPRKRGEGTYPMVRGRSVHGGEGGAASFLRPACGEKVAGRPDEGKPVAMRPANFAWDKEAKMEHPFYRCNG